jgi:hypothetical protein
MKLCLKKNIRAGHETNPLDQEAVSPLALVEASLPVQEEEPQQVLEVACQLAPVADCLQVLVEVFRPDQVVDYQRDLAAAYQRAQGEVSLQGHAAAFPQVREEDCRVVPLPTTATFRPEKFTSGISRALATYLSIEC